MKRFFIFFVSFFSLLVFMSYAQEVTGEIIGKVTLSENGSPLPGATVTLTGQTYGKNTFVTTKEGNYRFWKLAPGNYELKFELQGFKTVIRSGIRVNILSTLTVNVTMEPGAIEEEVTVIGQVPTIDTRKARIGVSFTSDVVQSLPVANRVPDIINLAPGIMTPHPLIAGQGSASGVVHGFGVRHLRAEFSLDGASFRATYGAGGMPTTVNPSRIEETQVTTSGHDISNIEGGPTINFVTKRGGNRLAGEAYIALLDKYFQSKKSLPANMGLKPANPAPGVTYLGYTAREGIFRTYDYGGSLGGPILSDHLWFFGSWGVIYQWDKNYYDVPGAPQYFPDLYGKINFQWKKTMAEVSYAHTDNAAINVPYSSVSPQNRDRLNPCDTYMIQANQTLWEKLLLSAKFTFFNRLEGTSQANFVWTGKGNTYDEGRTYNPPGRFYTYNYFKSPPYNTEASSSWPVSASRQKRPYLVLEGNYFAEGFLGGDHEVKFGFDRNYARYIEERLVPNQGECYAYPATSSSSDPTNAPSKGALGYYWGVWGTYPDRYGERRSTRSGFYLQDIATYRRLTAIVGIRIDQNAWAWDPVTFHGVAPNDQPITAWDQWTGPVTIEAGNYKLTATISPRISLTYDLSGKGRDLVKVSYAQFRGALDNEGFHPGLQVGNTRCNFEMPFIDYDGDYVVDIPNEVFLLDPRYLGHWPTPADIQMMKAKGQQEKAALEAIYGVGKVPWNAYTYPGWFYLQFYGSPLGNQTPKGTPTAFMAKDFEPENVTEVMASYEKMLGKDISLQFLLAYKKENNLLWQRPYVGTPSNYTLLPVQTNIPVGTDPVTGWTIYQADPSLPLATGTMITSYKKSNMNFGGAEFIFTKRFSHGWMLQASADLQDWRRHYDKDEVPMSTLFDYRQDAPYEVFQYRSSEPGQNVRWHFKVSGIVQLPFGINLSGFVDARDGFPVNNWVNSYLGQSLPKKDTKYGDYRQPSVWFANLTLEKTFLFTENVSSSVYITGYNITDNMTQLMINESKVPTTIDQATSVMKPRIFQIGMRFKFR